MRVQSLRLSGGSFLLALLAMCCLAAPAAAQPKPYSMTVSPASVPGGQSVTFTVTLNNLANPQSLGSANVTVPAAFTGVTADAPATVSGNTLQLRNLAIPPGGTRSVTVAADVPCLAGTFAWAVVAKQANDFNGPPGNNFDLTGSTADRTTNVTGACGSALRFAGAPANARAGQAITTSPYNSPPGGPVSVEIVGPDGKRVSTSGTVVTISLAAGGGPGTLSGTTSATTVAGLASFSNLSIDLSGTYQLVATAPGLPSVTSGSFFIDDFATRCFEDAACTAELSNADATLDVTAAPSSATDAGFLVINRKTGLDCAGYDELVDGDFAVDFRAAPGIGRTKVVTATISKAAMAKLPENGAAHVEMCFGAPFFFDVKPGSPPLQDSPEPFVGLLPDCGGSFGPPCVSRRSKTKAGQGVIEVQAPGSDHDPRYGP